MYPEDQTVLSYHDAKVTVKDVQSIKPRCWITDNVLNFYVEYIERNFLGGEEPDLANLSDSFSIIGPSVVQMLKFFDLEDFVALESLQLPSKKLILFPLNDANRDEGGSHWSLLVYVNLGEPTFYHLDSLNGKNKSTSHRFCSLLGKYLCNKDDLTPVSPDEIGQQTNMYDCGIMVVLFIDYIFNFFKDNHSFDTSWLHYDFKLKDCRDKRDSLLKLIEKLHTEDYAG